VDGKRLRTRKVKDRSLYEHPPGSGVWWVRLMVQGKRRKWRVGPKEAARHFRDKVFGEIAEGRFFPERMKRKRAVPLLADWIADYLPRTASTRRDTAGATRYAYLWTPAPETAGKTMAEVTTTALETYRERRRAEGGGTGRRRSGKVGATTVNKELSFLRAVFNDYLRAQEEADPTASLPANPVRKRLFLAEPTHRVRYLLDDEQDALQAALSPAEWTKVLVALCTGLDRGPQFTLRWDAVDLHARMIQTPRHKGGNRGGRGAILVTTPINDELLVGLRDLPSRLTSPWVFPNAAGTGPLAADTWVRHVFKPALRVAGIRDFRWKDLRHTYATRLNARNGVGMKTIATLLGHTTTRMTERYTHVTDLLGAVQGVGRAQNAKVVAPNLAPSAVPRPKRTAR
jgi:integrase